MTETTMTETTEQRRTVVLVHGLLCDATVWTHQSAALSAEYEVLVPELRGFDSLTTMATSILDSTDGSFDLVGHSMGGRVALEIVRLAPTRVDSLVLLDTGVHPVGDAEPAGRQVLLDLADREGIAAVADAWIPPMVHADRHADEALMTAMRHMVESYSVDDFRRQVGALLRRQDATPLLAQIACPTLVGCGRQDAWSTLQQHEQIASAIPSARLEVIEDSGHMISVEQPDAVTTLLLDFLTSVERRRTTMTDDVRTASGWQCEQLLRRAAMLLDRRDWDAYADCFTDDAVIARPSDPDRPIVGREAILASLRARPPRITCHILANSVIDISSADEATAESRVVLYSGAESTVRPAPGDPPVVGTFVDRLRRDRGAWKIYERQGSIELELG